MAVNLSNTFAREVNETGWQGFRSKADSYFETSTRCIEKQGKLGPGIVFNLLSMAIEGYFMAFFIRSGNLPTNHTMEDLCDSSRGMIELDEDLVKNLKEMDKVQDLCSLEIQKDLEVSWTMLGKFLESAGKVKKACGF